MEPHYAQPHFVYVLHAPVTGLVKVGLSRDPARRLTEIQTMSADPPVLVGSFECANLNAALRVEQEAHAALAEHRRHGEWFAVAPATAVAAIASILNLPPPGCTRGFDVVFEEGRARWQFDFETSDAEVVALLHEHRDDPEYVFDVLRESSAYDLLENADEWGDPLPVAEEPVVAQ